MKSKNECVFNKRFNILFLDGTLKITKILILFNHLKYLFNLFQNDLRVSEVSCKNSQAYILKV